MIQKKDKEQVHSTLLKALLIALGSLFVALGTLGIFLPLLPTTPFLLLASACYIRSSEKLYNRLLYSKWFGEHIKNYRDGKGMPLHAKVISIALLWLTIGYSYFYVVEEFVGRVILVCILLAVTTIILSIRTLKTD